MKIIDVVETIDGKIYQIFSFTGKKAKERAAEIFKTTIELYALDWNVKIETKEINKCLKTKIFNDKENKYSIQIIESNSEKD